MNKKYFSATRVAKRETERFDPDKSRYEKFMKNNLLTNILCQVKDEIVMEETHNHQNDTVEYKLGLAILTIEEHDKLKRIEREYNRFF